MLKNSVLAILLTISLSGCFSVLSITSDDQAWKEYFSEIKAHLYYESRGLASRTSPDAVEHRVEILRKILAEMPFRNFLVSCESAECYRSQLVIAYDQAFQRVKDQKIALTNDEYVAEQKLFLNLYSYEKMLNWVEAFHQKLLSGVELRSSQRAIEELVQGCELTSLSETESRLSEFGPFLGGTSYLPRHFYACINGHWNEELDQLLKETSGRLGVEIKSAEAKQWIIKNQISPIYQKTLSQHFQKKAQEELVKWKQNFSQFEAKVNWSAPLEQILKKEVPELRNQYRYINVNALLTDRRLSKK